MAGTGKIIYRGALSQVARNPRGQPLAGNYKPGGRRGTAIRESLAKEGLKTSEGGILFFNDKGQVVGYQDPILKQSYAFSKPYDFPIDTTGNYSNQELNRIVSAERTRLEQPQTKVQTKDVYDSVKAGTSTVESLKPLTTFPSTVRPVTSEFYSEPFLVPQTSGFWGTKRGSHEGEFLASGGTPVHYLGYSLYERYVYPFLGRKEKYNLEKTKEKLPSDLKFIPDFGLKLREFATGTSEKRALSFGIITGLGEASVSSIIRSPKFTDFKINIRDEQSITKVLTKYSKGKYTETTSAGVGTAKVDVYKQFKGFLGKGQEKGLLPKIDLKTYELGAVGKGFSISKGRSFVSGNIGTGGIRQGSDVYVFPIASRSTGTTTKTGFTSEVVPASYLKPKTLTGDLTVSGKLIKAIKDKQTRIILPKNPSRYRTTTEGGVVTGEGYADVSGTGTSLFLDLPKQPSTDSGLYGGSTFIKQVKQQPSLKFDTGGSLIKETVTKGKDVLKTDSLKVIPSTKPIISTSTYETPSGVTSTKQEFKMDLKPSSQSLVTIPRQDIKLKSDLKFSYKTPSTSQRAETRMGMGMGISSKYADAFKTSTIIVPDVPTPQRGRSRTTPTTTPTFNFGGSYKLPPLIPLIPPIIPFIPSGGLGSYSRTSKAGKRTKEYKPTLYSATVKLEVPRITKKIKFGAETGLGARPIPTKKIKLKKWF